MRGLDTVGLRARQQRTACLASNVVGHGGELPPRTSVIPADLRMSAGVDDALAQQQFGQAVTGPHQITTAVFTSMHQITRGPCSTVGTTIGVTSSSLSSRAR